MFLQRATKPGFSVIELVFWVALVSIVMAAFFQGFKGANNKVRKWSTTTQLRNISQAIDTYYADVQPARYPETLEDLAQQPTGVKNWEGPYIELKNGELPKDGWGNDFVYERTPGKTHPYELYSRGVNGEEAPEEEWISVWQ